MVVAIEPRAAEGFVRAAGRNEPAPADKTHALGLAPLTFFSIQFCCGAVSIELPLHHRHCPRGLRKATTSHRLPPQSPRLSIHPSQYGSHRYSRKQTSFPATCPTPFRLLLFPFASFAPSSNCSQVLSTPALPITIAATPPAKVQRTFCGPFNTCLFLYGSGVRRIGGDEELEEISGPVKAEIELSRISIDGPKKRGPASVDSQVGLLHQPRPETLHSRLIVLVPFATRLRSRFPPR